MKNFILLIFGILFVFGSCSKDNNPENPDVPEKTAFIRAADISSFPEINAKNVKYYNSNGTQEELLAILKNAGVNTIRLRLWVNPSIEHSGFNEVKSFSSTLKSQGFKTWISVHYSDTWADPGHQETPKAWQNISFAALKDSVSQYTKKVVKEMNPDFIQIGNEINAGMLFPGGNLNTQPAQFKELLQTGIQAVRNNSTTAKIMIHFAGIQNSDWFFSQISAMDFDIIGLSYYPAWHGKNLSLLQSTMENLSLKYRHEIVIAETAYPFTLGYNDWTNNIIGLEEHLILPDYPATPEGQQKFIAKLKTISSEVEKGIGFCYWGAELIAFDGPQSTNGSPWENQALFDFQNKAVPALSEFRAE